MRATFKQTKIAGFVGVGCQAVVANLTAILFVPLMELYGLTYAHLGMLVAVNFIAQVAIDLLCSPLVDRIGYKKMILPACILTVAGLLFYGLTPYLMPNRILIGIIIATVIFAMACGLMEILLSPLIMAIPEGDNNAATGLLHSFYAWGQVAVIIVTTLLVLLLGRERWNIIPFIWAAAPVLALLLFLRAPFPDVVSAEHRQKQSKIWKDKVFIAALFAIFFGGATEIVMSQWSSSFMEKGLLMPKITGDLVGMCGFSILFGLGRTLYGFKGKKVDVNKLMLWGSVVCIACYLAVGLVPVDALVVIACAVCGIAVCLLWPGVIVSAGNRFPTAGAWIFAILAVAGDLGAGLGPMLTGAVADAANNTPASLWLAELLHITAEQAALRFAILIGAVFPLGALISNVFLTKFKNKPLPGTM